MRLSRATLGPRPKYDRSNIAPGTVNGAMKAVAVAIPSPTWRRDDHRLLCVQNCRRFCCNAFVAMLSLVGLPTASRPLKLDTNFDVENETKELAQLNEDDGGGGSCRRSA